MTELQIGYLLIAAMVFLVIAGMQVGVVLFSLSFIGIWLIKDNFETSSRMLALSSYSGIQDIVFATIPLFVLMGMFVSIADLGKDTFEVAEWLLRKIAGGLGMAVVVANAIFAAVTGISIASAAVFTRIAVPELLKNGYSPQLAVGTVAGSSILGMLIPPSILFILYGIVAEESIGKLFIAGVIPGIIMSIAFCVGIYIMVVYFKGFAGTVKSSVELANAETWTTAVQKLVPVASLVVLILGGLYSGVFTPTEAGAVGAMGAFVIALIRGRLTWKRLWRVLVETGYVSVSILILLIAANLYSRMLTYSGVPVAIGEVLEGLGVVGFFAVYIAIIIGLGCILDSTSILLIVVPIVVPIAKGFGIDLIHFGVITVIAVEIGLLTPPLGLSAFAVKSSLADQTIRLGDVFKGSMPFVAVMLIVLVLVVVFPALSTYLVR
ncbi:MAG: TRAP transporter large permease subunit [Betaproteobacteria bacterium]|nr:TRAP transporter large permease subunit [Betaproteobacteria bacterium]